MKWTNGLIKIDMCRNHNTSVLFFFAGMNSIVVYLCSELLHGSFPINIKVPETHAAQLAIDIYGASMWLILSIVLYYKGIFVAI